MAGSGRPPEGRQGRGPGPAAELREEQSPPDTAVSPQEGGSGPGGHETSTVLSPGSYPA